VRRPSEWTVNQKLAAVALVLGLGALVIGAPSSSGRVTLDTRELAAIVEGEVDHVTPEDVADWLVAGRQDFRLVDLRSKADFGIYHLPGAERIPITEIEDAGLPRNEKIVLYSQGGIHAAQAWMLLKARRYPAVYLLLGGLDQWNERVLYPRRPPEGASSEELAQFERAAARAQVFGGAPRSAATVGEATETVAPPPPPAAIAPPALPPGATSGAQKKRKEGC
jgi:rhodanese-related sulfurtransferase